MLTPDDLDPADVPPVLMGHSMLSFLDDELQDAIDDYESWRRPAGFSLAPR